LPPPPPAPGTSITPTPTILKDVPTTETSLIGAFIAVIIAAAIAIIVPPFALVYYVSKHGHLPFFGKITMEEVRRLEAEEKAKQAVQKGVLAKKMTNAVSAVSAASQGYGAVGKDKAVSSEPLVDEDAPGSPTKLIAAIRAEPTIPEENK
jgi:hypothetical protein